MLIGPDFKPFYARTGQGPRRQHLAAGGVEDRRRHGLGLDLVRSRRSTSSTTAPAIPGPGIPTQRPGDNQWTTRLFARDPDTGEAKWAYQCLTRTTCTTTTASTRTCCSICRSAARRARCCCTPIATAIIYVIDRATGEVLSADPFARVNTIDRRRPQDRPAGRGRRRRSRSRARWSATSVRPLPGAQGLAADRVLAADQAALHPAPATCAWTWRRTRGQLHRRHAVRRRERSRCRPAPAAIAASSRRGIRRAQEGVGHQGGLPVWSGALRHGRRRRLLRHDGRLVQGGGRETGKLCGKSKSAPGSSASRSPIRALTASNTSRCSRALAAGPARSRPRR